VKHTIKFINSKYYVFIVDSLGNLYDTMRHFETHKQAVSFIIRDRGVT
jgi:hypothetical protein